MTVVKGVYRGNSVELLKPVKAKEGTEVEVIFREVGEENQLFVEAMKQELERMERGIRLGGGSYYQSRDDLRER